MASLTKEQRSIALANRLVRSVTARELVALSWMAIERNDELTEQLLDAYERVRELREWVTI